jgi:ribose transport system ATP-binding protein
LLRVRKLCKAYGPVQALDVVDFDLHTGEVHALVGENGAGKSTLSRILCGLTLPDAGTIALDNIAYTPRNRRDADSSGVRMVMQELNLVNTLTVAECLFIGDLPHRWGWIDRSTLHQQARQALTRVGLSSLDPDLPVGRLGVGKQQLVEIAAGLARRCRILILDEPTAALTDPEIVHLFERIAELKQGGTAILYISHRMEELQRIADRISVLRDGRMITTRPASGFSMDDIVRSMVGRDLDQCSARTAREPGPVALRVRHLCAGPTVHDVSFEVREGEILGMAGLMGSGRTEAMRALYGADPREGGEVFVGAASDPVTFRTPRQAVRSGIALLTENRKEQGLLMPLSIRDNTTLPSLTRLQTWGGWLQAKTERAASWRWTSALGVRCHTDQQSVSQLSGGNQQKIILARWLLRDCKILILDEPTRGIDVGAKLEIYRLLERLAAERKALVVVSSDLPELMRVADRIAVMSAGRLVQTFTRNTWSEDAIMKAALTHL